MASSTTMPSTRIKPITVSVEMLMSVAGSTAMAPMSATGMPMATHIASLNSKNSARMTNTSIRPPPALCVRTDMRSCKSSPPLIQMVVFSPSGSLASNCATTLLVFSTMSMRSSVSTWETLIVAARAPSNSAIKKPSSKVSRTSAMSPNSNLVPSGRVLTTTSANSSLT